MTTTSTTLTQTATTNRFQYLADREGFLSVAMLVPAVIYIALLVGFPFILAILFSFSDVTVGNPTIDRLSFDTFSRVIADSNFRQALGNNFFFTITSQIIMIIMAYTLSLTLMRDFRGKWLVRLFILLPWATPIAISSIGWLWMLDSVFSPIDWMFRQVSLLGPGGLFSNASNMYWLGEPALARLAVILIQVWRMLPMSTVILLAGMTSIPGDIKDAVQVDGADFWMELFQVTIPLMRPIIIVAFLFGVIFTFTDMTVIYVLTQGGPVNSTQVLASWAFYKGIEGGNLAEGAATAIFLLPVLLGVAMVMLRLARRTEM
jgi:multiple sugar transport system permease protein